MQEQKEGRQAPFSVAGWSRPGQLNRDYRQQPENSDVMNSSSRQAGGKVVQAYTRMHFRPGYKGSMGTRQVVEM